MSWLSFPAFPAKPSLSLTLDAGFLGLILLSSAVAELGR